MYLRHSTVRKDGKTHTYWRLVRSVRCGGKVRQETVAQLGELDAQGRASAQALARHITGRADQYELFEDRTLTPAKVEVQLDGVRLERARGFGDVWLAWTLWRGLHFDQVCSEQMPDGRETVAWSTMCYRARCLRRAGGTSRQLREGVAGGGRGTPIMDADWPVSGSVL